MPTKLLSILAVIVILATATGCDSGNGGNNQALTKEDFANDPTLRAVPDNGVLVDFLEPPDSDTPRYDTRPSGHRGRNRVFKESRLRAKSCPDRFLICRIQHLHSYEVIKL